MKRISAGIMLVAVFLPLNTMAQEQTLMGGKDVDHGGYGALVTKFTSVNDQFGVLVGIRGGWIIDHTVAIGIGGYGLVNSVHANKIGPQGEPYVNLGYGGLDVEYIAYSNNVVHYSIHTLVGAGALGFRYSWEHVGNYDYPYEGYAPDYHFHDSFFVLEPGVNLDVNVTTWFRASIGASYRYVSGVSSGASTNAGLRGASGMISLRFGSF